MLTSTKCFKPIKILSQSTVDLGALVIGRFKIEPGISLYCVNLHLCPVGTLTVIVVGRGQKDGVVTPPCGLVSLG